jgi:hypothetical protein
MTEPDEHADFEVSWGEVAAAVFKARGIKSGLWRLAVRLQFAGTTLGWHAGEGPTQHKPTALVGVESLVMFPVTEPGPMVFDAAETVAALAEAGPAARAKAKAKAKPRSRVKV